MAANHKQRYTLEEHFDLERRSEERYEYRNGEVFCRSGVSEAHAEIEMNIAFYLRSRLTNRGCRIFPANIRLKVPSMPPYRYPDVSAVCGESEFENVGGIDVLINPSLIIEVLSDSTEAYDRGDKFTHYKSIPSFSEYLLVAQHRPHVTQFVKQDGGAWLQRELNEIDGTLTLVSLNCELSLKEIYQNVRFAENPPPGNLRSSAG